MGYVYETDVPVEIDLEILAEDFANQLSGDHLLDFVRAVMDYRDDIYYTQRVIENLYNWIAEYDD